MIHRTHPSLLTWDCAATGDCYYEGEGAVIPNGNRPMSSPAYPLGPAGGVSITNNNANFSFSDGHAKNVNAVSTNPDSVAYPAKNMWNSTR